MRFERVLELVADDPVFETGLLLAGDTDSGEVRRQLSRWVKTGKVIQLRRGYYVLGQPFCKRPGHPFVLANSMDPGSYVSLQSALAFHGLIPEHVPVVTSVTRGRPGRWDTQVGSFEYRHLKPTMLAGYEVVEPLPGQRAFVAGPAKALADLLYLHPGSDDPAYIEELRLQNLEEVPQGELHHWAAVAGSGKLERAVALVECLARREGEAYEGL